MCVACVVGLVPGEGKFGRPVRRFLSHLLTANMVFEIKLNGTVVTTGGNRGIGLAISKACAQAGANVAILYHSNPDAEKTAEEVAKEYGVKVKAYKCDVSDAELVKKTIQQAESELGQITGLAANAGVSIVKPALELTPEDFYKVFNVNVLGVFNACKSVAQHWVETGFEKGSIAVSYTHLRAHET